MRSGQGLVNLAAISPSSEESVKTNIAKIDGTVGVHKLARFRMYGFQGGENSGLSISVPGVQKTKKEAVRKWNYKTKSHTLATTGRFKSTPIEIGLDDQWYTHTVETQLDEELIEGITNQKWRRAGIQHVPKSSCGQTEHPHHRPNRSITEQTPGLRPGRQVDSQCQSGVQQLHFQCRKRKYRFRYIHRSIDEG